MNYFRHFDSERYCIDFVTHDISEDSYMAELEELGSKVYKLPPFSIGSVSVIKSEFDKILTEHPEYEIIHCHMANAAVFYYSVAKKHGIEIRILHSHQNKAADTWTHAIRNLPLLALGRRASTDYVACTQAAGDFLFGRHSYAIVKNAIDIHHFAYDENVRAQVRRQLEIPEESLVVGHVGRFCPQKNQMFLLDIFKAMLLLHPDSRLLLIGEGDDEELLTERVNELEISDKVHFFGVADDVAPLYQAMDVFAFPSLYEGLGIVAIEAQANGLACLMSNGVPTDAKVLESTTYLSLNDDEMTWAKKLIALAGAGRDADGEKLVAQAGYDINVEADKLMSYYDGLYSKAHEGGNI